jgi:hypothetical protein
MFGFQSFILKQRKNIKKYHAGDFVVCKRRYICSRFQAEFIAVAG